MLMASPQARFYNYIDTAIFFPWLCHVPSAGARDRGFILLCLFLKLAFAFNTHQDFNQLWPHDVCGLRVEPQQLVGAVLLQAVVSVWGFPFFGIIALENLQLCVGSACVKSDCNSHLISQLKDCIRKLLRGLGYWHQTFPVSLQFLSLKTQPVYVLLDQVYIKVFSLLFRTGNFQGRNHSILSFALLSFEDADLLAIRDDG